MIATYWRQALSDRNKELLEIIPADWKTWAVDNPCEKTVTDTILVKGFPSKLGGVLSETIATSNYLFTNAPLMAGAARAIVADHEVVMESRLLIAKTIMALVVAWRVMLVKAVDDKLSRELKKQACRDALKKIAGIDK